MEGLSQFGSAIAIGLSCIGVAIGQGYLTFKAMETIGKNPKMSTYYLTIAILGIALVESAAIYGLIMAFQILTTQSIDGLSAIGIGMAIGFAGLGVGIGEGKMVSAAFEAINKQPENKNKIMTYMILFLALIESAAIYGLVVGFQILSNPSIDGFVALAAGSAIGLAGLGVGIGEGILAQRVLNVISYDFNRAGYYLTIAILGIALVESAAIYGLIIAFQVLSLESINGFGILGAGLAIGFAGLGVGIGEGKMVSGSLHAMFTSPSNRGKILTFMILFLALIESAAIYGLISAFQIISSQDISSYYQLGAGLAIGLAGLGVGIGEGILAKKSLEVISRDFQNSSFYLTVSILGIALVESAAIYGLILSMQLLSSTATLDLSAISVGLAIGLAGLGVGIGEGIMVSGALEAMKSDSNSKRKLMTFMILFLALIESAAIYALVVSFGLIDNTNINQLAALGAGLAVGFAGLGVGVGEGILSKKSLLCMGENPAMKGYFLTVTILGIALVESAAIYALVIAFQLGAENAMNISQAVGVGLAVGLAGLGVGIGEGNMVSGAISAIAKNPQQKNKILTFMILFLALIESAAIYGLVMAFQLIGADIDMFSSVGVGLAVGLAGLGVGVGEGILARRSMEVISDDFKNVGYYITITILGIALVESAAIYGLIVGVQLLSNEFIDTFAAVGVGLAIGLAGLGVGIGEGKMVGEALGAMKVDQNNKRKILTFMILFIALIESVAIYGLVVSTQLLNTVDISGFIAIGAGLAVGLAGLGVGIGEGVLSAYSMEVIGKRPKMHSSFLTTTILGIALVESAAIYGLVIAFQIIGLSPEMALAGLGAGAAIGLAALGAGVGEGMLVGGTFHSLYRNPSFKSRDLAFMVLFLALIEVLAIYGLIVAYQILS